MKLKSRLKIWMAIITTALMLQNIEIKAESVNGDTWISETAKEACVEIGGQYNICPELLEAIIEAESWGIPTVENGDCKGLMQVSEHWHKDRIKRLGVTDLYDEYENILVGTDLLYELFQTYGDVGIVLMAYHGEPDALQKAENGQLSDYARKILERSAYLERLHEEKEREEQNERRREIETKGLYSWNVTGAA